MERRETKPECIISSIGRFPRRKSSSNNKVSIITTLCTVVGSGHLCVLISRSVVFFTTIPMGALLTITVLVECCKWMPRKKNYGYKANVNIKTVFTSLYVYVCIPEKLLN